MPTLLQSLAQRCHADWSGTFSPVERNLLCDIVRAAWMDTAACILAGRAEAPVDALLRWAAPRLSVDGEATVLFGAERTDAATAALLNGVAGHALDYDDVGLAGHPSVVIVPALMAEHERLERAGARPGGAGALVDAYAKAYAVWAELQRRMRVALHARGWHPSAVFGTVAAAAGVACLRGLDAAGIGHAIGIAASMASGVIANFGSGTKPLQVGRACQAGIAATDLAQAGLDASPDALDGRAGLLVALAGDPDRVDVESAVPEAFEYALLQSRPGIKRYPVCYASHRVIDGVIALAREHDVDPARVARITAWISRTAAGVLRFQQPQSLTQARFSLEYCAALAATRRQLGMAEFTRLMVDDAQVGALMRRTSIETVDTQCPLEPSFAFTDRVALTLDDGSVLDSGPIRFARGHACNPMSDAELVDKLVSCAGERLARDVLRRIDQLLPVQP
jgi:aconitate decarboxylase